MNYVIVWKEGANILEDGELLKGVTKKQIIKFWLESGSVKIANRYFIIFFGDGTIYDDILYRKYKEQSPWRHETNVSMGEKRYKQSIAKYIKERAEK